MIQLGNLNMDEVQDRLGVTFSDKLLDYMKNNHQAKASNIEPGKWHCFDIPFMVMCGDLETAIFFKDELSPLSDKFKQSIQIAY